MDYLNKYGISRFFDTPDLPFFIIRYDKGETIIHPMEHTRYLQFVVEGTVDIYAVRRDGSQFTIASADDFLLLGDVEFVSRDYPILFAEAKSDAAAVALSLEENKPVLDRDLTFLHYILRSLAKKIEQSTRNEAEFLSLEDKLLHYIEYYCPNGLLVHIGKAAENLHCSRRQLQRILRRLTEQGILEKTARGVYRRPAQSSDAFRARSPQSP